MNAYLDYLTDGAMWSVGDPAAFPHRILEHLGYTGVALVLGFLIAFPVGVLIGHTGKGALLAINIGNAGRALPTLGVVLLVVSLAGVGLVAPLVALVLLAIPPILTATYAGVSTVTPSTVDAARGVGLTESQIAWRVEVPMALPIIIGGVRNAALQVISTATIMAYVGEGGLGRFLFDGMALQEYDQVVGGAVVLAVLAVLVDLLLALVQRLVVSPGVRPRAERRRRPVVPVPAGTAPAGTAPVGAAGTSSPIPATTVATSERSAP